ncbi:hypothetical protein NSQ62_08210 [Solibacillus sp. FSL H8-0523]|uniref:hypothetical protein n=1 Tax=Solibacillus sp. FSL H8-0523 TaxID=2954511 RepID=UPI0031010CC6
MEYGKALDLVKATVSFESAADVNLVKSFAEVTETEKALEIVAVQYQQASERVSDFNLTVFEYVLAILEQEDKIKEADYYENEIDAENDGFWWIDEISKWVKLDFTKTHINY